MKEIEKDTKIKVVQPMAYIHTLKSLWITSKNINLNLNLNTHTHTHTCTHTQGVAKPPHRWWPATL
jgi:hypothetical protein